MLYVVENGVVLNDGQIFRLAKKLLVRVDARPEHLRSLLRAHLAHLLGHLVGRWRDQTLVSRTERETGVSNIEGAGLCTYRYHCRV